METHLNHATQFDEVRWATMRKTSYDSRLSFRGSPQKQLLAAGTKLYRLVPMVTGDYYYSPWWMPESTFTEIRKQANHSAHGGGRLFRNYVAQAMALRSGTTQLCVVEIRLNNPVYAWVGRTAALFDRPGGMEQVFLPNLADQGSPRTSSHAQLVRTYWLKL
jgi:hypothetical protein